ncbi:unnamed protein product [Ambrosiozyma monospora]|uniref:Unnamed protein product n=1 Tax=Ambrosiozyma monospora TaxID=43982 RepID=A0ACB5SXH8_AMBMO|nr:unnamed protein product [Ambrosiozyma monospora]
MSLMRLISKIFKKNNGLNLDSAYAIPDKNQFIPTDFSLVDIHEPESEEIVYPKLIQTNNDSKIWFKANTKLGGPRSAVTLKFNLPGSTSTPLNSLLMSLFVEMLDDDLNSVSYLASIAGLQHEVNVAREGLSLDVIGYSHKLENLLEVLIETFVKFTNPDKFDEVWNHPNKERELRFNAIKEKLTKSLKNFGYSVPYNQVGPIISSLINENSWLVDDEIESLKLVNYNSLKHYAANLLNICVVEVLIVGNYDKQHSLKISQMIESKLTNSLTLTQSQFTRGRSLNLPTNHTYHYIKQNDDIKNINSCIEVFVQCGLISQDPKGRVITELIAQIMHEPFFNRLRTQEQLGYVVFSGIRETRTTYGLRLLIQSEKSTFYLLERIQSFLSKLGSTTISQMSEKEFQKHVGAVITKKQTKLKNLREARSRFWNRIATGYYDFNRRETDVSILKTLTLQDLQSYFQNKIMDSNNHGCLVVHLQSQIVPQVKFSNAIKAHFFNYIYQFGEFDELEYPHNEIDDVVDEFTSSGSNGDVGNDTNIEKLISLILTNSKIQETYGPEFFQNHKSDLIKYIKTQLAQPYNDNLASIKNLNSKISGTGKGEGNLNEIIEHTGEWKSSIPLTFAPDAKILDVYLDKETDGNVVEAKL